MEAYCRSFAGRRIPEHIVPCKHVLSHWLIELHWRRYTRGLMRRPSSIGSLHKHIYAQLLKRTVSRTQSSCFKRVSFQGSTRDLHCPTTSSHTAMITTRINPAAHTETPLESSQQKPKNNNSPGISMGCPSEPSSHSGHVQSRDLVMARLSLLRERNLPNPIFGWLVSLLLVLSWRLRFFEECGR